jgi:hypothetical protein
MKERGEQRKKRNKEGNKERQRKEGKGINYS